MLSDRDALLGAIRAAPDEDTPRLVFADWLDENGEPERAEFVRVQCELARLTDDRSDSQPVYEFLRDRDWVTRPAADWASIDAGIHRRLALVARADELLARHGGDWTPKLPKRYRVKWEGFRRGFPHRVNLDGRPDRNRSRAEAAARLCKTVPAVTLAAHDFTAQTVERFADAGALDWLAGLDVSGDSLSGVRELGHRPETAGVRALAVRHHNGLMVAAEVAAALTETPHWTGLRALDLSTTTLGDGAAAALFRAPHLRGLTRLHLRGRHWTADTVRAFAAGGFAALTSLRLTHCGLDDDAAEALAGCADLAGLRDLDPGHNQITGRGVTSLLCSPHLRNVAFLGLEDNPLHGLDAEKLAALEPAGLRMLHAHSGRFRTADVRALARCPRLRTLWYLDLDANNLPATAVRELIRGFGKWCPPILWLTYNRLGDRGAELLADWKAAAALRVLHVRYNRGMTDVGARALLDSPHLANLNSLGVSATGETELRLRTRFPHTDGY